jgi:hypothetical protein
MPPADPGWHQVETIDDILEEPRPLDRKAKTASDQPPVRHSAEMALFDQERSLLGQPESQPSGVVELSATTGNRDAVSPQF